MTQQSHWLGAYPKEIKSECQRNARMPILNTALSNMQDMGSTLFIDKWIKKMWYEGKMEYLSVIKINGFLSFVAMWLDHFIFGVISRHRKSNITCCHMVKYKNTLHRRNKSQGSTAWRWWQLTRTLASSRKQFLPLYSSAFVGGSPLRCWLLDLLHLGWTEALESDLGICLLARGSREREPEPLSPPLLTSLGHK